MFESIDRGWQTDLPRPEHSLIFFLWSIASLVNHVDPDSLDCTRKELQVGMQIARGAIRVFAPKPDSKSRYEPPFGALAAICFNLA
jgi:hypothetical protein